MDSIYTIHNVKGGIKMKSITQRRILRLLLSLAMLIGLLPALGSIASCRRQRHHRRRPKNRNHYAELSSALSSGVTYVKLGANINTKDFNDGAGYTSPSNRLERFQLDLDGYSVTLFQQTPLRSRLPSASRATCRSRTAAAAASSTSTPIPIRPAASRC